MKHPRGSGIVESIVQLALLLNNVAVPHEIELPCEKSILPPHSFLHCVSVSFFECVSCKKITSAFFLRHHVKIVRLLLKLLMPLTFKEIIVVFKLTDINSLFVNNIF